MKGSKKYLACKDVTVIKVPHYKGLTVKDIIEFVDAHVDVHSYLPDFNMTKCQIESGFEILLIHWSFKYLKSISAKKY